MTVSGSSQSGVLVKNIETTMNLSDLPNLWVPLALLSLIVLAAVYFSRTR
jgi:hypothetical protein